MKFRKKPVVIEAEQFNGSQGTHDMFMDFPIEKDEKGEYIMIPTLEGYHRADIGDWVITGAEGERYPCLSDIFEQTYEEVEE